MGGGGVVTPESASVYTYTIDDLSGLACAWQHYFRKRQTTMETPTLRLVDRFSATSPSLEIVMYIPRLTGWFTYSHSQNTVLSGGIDVWGFQIMVEKRFDLT